MFGKANTFAGVDGKNSEDRFAFGGVITPLNSRLKSNDELVADGGGIKDATG